MGGVGQLRLKRLAAILPGAHQKPEHEEDGGRRTIIETSTTQESWRAPLK